LPAFSGTQLFAAPNAGGRAVSKRQDTQRKRARTNGVVAIETVAHKLARAFYYRLRDRTDFDVGRAFA